VYYSLIESLDQGVANIAKFNRSRASIHITYIVKEAVGLLEAADFCPAGTADLEACQRHPAAGCKPAVWGHSL